MSNLKIPLPIMELLMSNILVSIMDHVMSNLELVMFNLELLICNMDVLMSNILISIMELVMSTSLISIRCFKFSTWILYCPP